MCSSSTIITEEVVKKLEAKAGSVFGRVELIEDLELTDSEGSKLFKVRCSNCNRIYASSEKNIYEDFTGCKICNPEDLAQKYFGGDYNKYIVFMKRWVAILNRCFNYKDAEAYSRYGARGITVHEPWRHSFKDFLAYISTLDGFDRIFTERLEIDRVDNNEGYIPGNLRFATTLENSRNKNNNTLIEYEGVKYKTWEFHEKFCKSITFSTFCAYAAKHSKNPEKLIEMDRLYKNRPEIVISYQSRDYTRSEFKKEFAPAISESLFTRYIKDCQGDPEKILKKCANYKGQRKEPVKIEFEGRKYIPKHFKEKFGLNVNLRKLVRLAHKNKDGARFISEFGQKRGLENG